jgi:conjugative relaxase-like TrwC/TraI family protein
MIKINKVAQKSGSAGRYYSEQGNKESYYNQDSQTVGQWHGQGLKGIGIKDGANVETTELDFILDGKTSNGKEKLTYNAGDEKRRKGYDVTFTPDKSVSIAYALSKENNDIEKANLIKNIHMEAVKATMLEIEKKANFRETKNHRTTLKSGGNLIYSEYVHEVNRELEPNLHSHCVISNLVLTPNGYKALDNAEILEYQKTFQRIYTNKLAKLSVENGISIESTKNGFRYSGISQELCDKYSKRSAQIKELLPELRKKYPAVSDVELREMAALATRKSKDTSKNLTATLDKEDLNQYEDFKKANENKEINENLNNIFMKPKMALEASYKDLSNKEAVFSENQLISKALDYSLLSSIDDIRKEIKKNKELIRLNEKEYTTREMIMLEKNIKKNFINGINSDQAIASKETITSGINNFETENKFNLSTEQKNAITTILNSKDRFAIIQGVAGAGKTTLLNCVNNIAKSENCELIAISFQGKAADEMARVLGKDVRSSTIESFKNMNLSGENKKLVIMDEASMTGLKDMDAVIEKCKQNNAKLVMLGDIKQIQSISAGNSFEQAQKLGLSTAELWESRRQKTEEYAKTVELFARGQSKKSFDSIIKNGKIAEFDDENKIKATIDKYNEFKLKNPDKSILITCNTNAEKDLINSIIHDQRVEKGEILNEKEYIVSKNKNLSEIDMRFAKNYEKDDKIFLKDNSVIGKSGEEFKIESTDNAKNIVNLVNLKTHEKKVLDLKDPDLTGKIGGITREESEKLGIGDRIMLLKNDRMFNVKNGQMGLITDIKDNFMTLKIGEENKETDVIKIDLNKYNNLTKSYAVSVNKSQGMTSDFVICSLKSDVINKNNFYVSLSRGKNDYYIITDNIDKTKENIEIAQKKTSALSFLREKFNDHKFGEKVVEKIKNFFHKNKENKIEKEAENKENKPIINKNMYNKNAINKAVKGINKGIESAGKGADKIIQEVEKFTKSFDMEM